MLLFFLFFSNSLQSQSVCHWDPEKKDLTFPLSEISGILNCDINSSFGKGHHFRNVIYKPTGKLLSPDAHRMKGAGMLNFYRVLIQGGYLTELWVETLANYPAFEILLSAYMASGFENGAYVAKKEFEPIEPEQIRMLDQPIIHGVWPFFPRNEAGVNLLTDGRHQKGRWYWRMAIGRRYALLTH